MSTPTGTDRHAAMRAWARGAYDLEAGVELAIRTGLADFDAWRDCWHDGYDGYYLDQDDLMRLVQTGAGWSGGERRLLAIVASLLNSNCPVNLGYALPGLDRRNIDLVLAAVSHAAGAHQHSQLEDREVTHGGDTFTIQVPAFGGGYAPPLHPWPAS